MARAPRSSPNLTREAVVEAAATVLERDGHAGLTMRAVAGALGVQAPALYWHFDDKQALELALYDHLMADLVFAPGGEDWRRDVRDMSQALRAHLIRRRDVGKLPPSGFFFTPNTAHLMEIALGVLLAAGLPPRDAFYAFTTLVDYVTTWSKAEPEMRARPHDRRPGFDEAARRAMTDGTYPHLAQVAQGFLEPSDLDEQFTFGLDCLIAGVARLIPPR